MAHLPVGEERKLILFNGPRHSGKDTAALRCVKTFNAFHFKMSAPNKAAIKSIFELTDADVEYLESIKTEDCSLLSGTSYVKAQISFSEDWMKQFFGEDIFGRLAARRLHKAFASYPEQGLFVCSDSGFASEAWPVIELFGKENVLLVRLYREGKTFAGDSRSYIELDGVETASLYNHGIESYRELIDNVVACFLAGAPLPL